MSAESRSFVLPVLPLHNTVLFPHTMVPLVIGRSGSTAAVEAAMASEEKTLAVIAQRQPAMAEPWQQDLFRVGTRGIIKRLDRSKETIEVMIQGIERVEVIEFEQTQSYLAARLKPLPVPEDFPSEAEALQREVADLAGRYFALAQIGSTSIDFTQIAAQVETPLHLVYLLGMTATLEVQKAQALLEANTVVDAFKLLHRYLTREVQVLELRQQIASQAQSQITRQQKEYILRQQMEAIQKELGEESPEESELTDLRKRLAEAELPDEVRTEAQRELSRLQRIPPAAPDHQVTRTYLELILDLPWSRRTEDVLDLANARAVLDEDHYDLEEIKERIVEQLAVLKLNPQAKAPILCFVGPPGVGKTSLGQSIARALGRKFDHFSLGGMHDEAELRGHRRTYIGAMPGRLIQAIRRAGVVNPLIMLDEIDKLGRDFRGDPAAALMEILDPAQNFAFRDNYLDLPFDLSRVFFITTANATDSVPRPLLDRMETLRLSGYSDEEKLQIARRYLLPRQRQEAGLAEADFVVPEETLLAVITRYTREAGVRELERMLGRLARKAAVRFAEGHTEPVTISPGNLTDLLGPERFFLEKARKELPAGVATGLAWTETGGDVLYVEATALPGQEKLTLTGQLGDVMKESAQAAQSYVRSHAKELGIDVPEAGVHIHVPAGAIPKDGPSAGVTMAAALASLHTGYPARSDTAMTGEITLSGLVLPVGGIKEKLLASHRAGIKRVILPKENKKDLRDLPEHVQREMQFVFAERIEEVLAEAIPKIAKRLRASAA